MSSASSSYAASSSTSISSSDAASSSTSISSSDAASSFTSISSSYAASSFTSISSSYAASSSTSVSSSSTDSLFACTVTITYKPDIKLDEKAVQPIRIEHRDIGRADERVFQKVHRLSCEFFASRITR